MVCPKSKQKSYYKQIVLFFYRFRMTWNIRNCSGETLLLCICVFVCVCSYCCQRLCDRWVTSEEDGWLSEIRTWRNGKWFVSCVYWCVGFYTDLHRWGCAVCPFRLWQEAMTWPYVCHRFPLLDCISNSAAAAGRQKADPNFTEPRRRRLSRTSHHRWPLLIYGIVLFKPLGPELRVGIKISICTGPIKATWAHSSTCGLSHFKQSHGLNQRQGVRITPSNHTTYVK